MSTSEQFEDRFQCTSCNAPGPLAHPRGPLRHHRFPFVFSNQTRPSRWSRRPPGMRLGPLGIPEARCATIVFHQFFLIKPAPAGGVDDSLECPKPFQDVALYNIKGSCSLTCSPKTTPLDQCGGVYGGRGVPEDRGFDCRLSMVSFHQLGKERWKRCHAYCRQTKVTYKKKSLLSPDKGDL